MSEEERRRCCLLGGCGCGPAGSAAQRQAMKEWLILEVLAEFPMTAEARERHAEAHLALLPWGKAAADLSADSVGEAV